MSPHGWLKLILEIVDSYQKGEQQRPLQQLAKRLSNLDENKDDNIDDPITEKIWGKSNSKTHWPEVQERQRDLVQHRGPSLER